MPYGPRFFGETDDLRVKLTEEGDETFTVVSATVTIADSVNGIPSTILTGRSGVSAQVDDTNKWAYYTETFSSANKYTEPTFPATQEYVATFKTSVTIGGATKILTHQDWFLLHSSIAD